MTPSPRQHIRGLLHGDTADERFQLAHHAPAPDLGDLVERYWITRWDRTGRSDHVAEVLPHPSVHVVVDEPLSGVFGVVSGKFERVLCGRGRAVGIKFWPGAFRAIRDAPVAELPDRRVPLAELFGERGDEYQRAVLATDDDTELVQLANQFVRSRRGDLDAKAAAARRHVETIACQPAMTRVDDLAHACGTPPRTLQRLFQEYVGVSPKWVIQRYRLHEAVGQLEAGTPVDFAELAVRLGYSDQAHFVRDFTRVVGRPPARYQKQVADR